MRLLKSIKKFYTEPLAFIAAVNLATIIGLLGVNVALFLGLQACTLCSIQRFISFGVAIISSSGIVLYGLANSAKVLSFFAGLVCAGSISSHLFAWYQLAVEKKILPLPSMCQYTNLDSLINMNVSELLQRKAMVPCDKPAYIMSMSIGELTLIGTGAIAILVLLFICSSFFSKKKKVTE